MSKLFYTASLSFLKLSRSQAEHLSKNYMCEYSQKFDQLELDFEVAYQAMNKKQLIKCSKRLIGLAKKLNKE